MTERRRKEARVKEALCDLEAPDEALAEERGRQVVEAAFSGREPTAMGGSRVAARAAIALLASLAVAGFALTPAGAEVREWIVDRFEAGEENAEPKLASLPTAGDVLVEAPSGVWIARDDGSRRRLGDFEKATWSPNGQFVGVSQGSELRAVDPVGEFRWSITAPAKVEGLDWSSDEGFRVAYLSGDEIGVVAGDGTGNETLAKASSVTPAWRPESDTDDAVHELAYVDTKKRVVLQDADTGQILWRTARFAPSVSELGWSSGGERLLVEAGDFKTVLDSRGEPVFKGPLIFNSSGEGAISPSGEEVAFVRKLGQGFELSLFAIEGGRERILYRTGPGARGDQFDEPVFSPDGEWILLPWRAADQWLFVPVGDGRVSAVADITRQFSSGSSEAAFPRVAGWCCAP
jgi:hypothetical protein